MTSGTAAPTASAFAANCKQTTAVDQSQMRERTSGGIQVEGQQAEKGEGWYHACLSEGHEHVSIAVYDPDRRQRRRHVLDR